SILLINEDIFLSDNIGRCINMFKSKYICHINQSKEQQINMKLTFKNLKLGVKGWPLKGY
ncbi:MAG: hypothetical protein ACJASR_002354, partial [Psychroserpens sp.]